MNKYLVCLDYGHGGRDLGASYKGRYESKDVLRLGRLVAAILRQAGLDLVETRVDDSYIGLYERASLANRRQVDLFVSIHRNAFIAEQARGVEVFVYQRPRRSSWILAQGILKSLVDLGFKDRGVKLGNFFVLRETRAPALLIELGFLDNSQDNLLFDRKLDLIAASISREILKSIKFISRGE